MLCFTDRDYRVWTELHSRAVDKVHSVFGFDTAPFDWGLMVNIYEFFAGLTQYYFFQNDPPRRYAEQFFPEAFAFLEEFYGILTPKESDRPGYVQYVTDSGISLPWLVPGGVTYEHSTFGYSMELLPGWEVEHEDSYGSSLPGQNWPWPSIRIEHIHLSDSGDVDDELMGLAASSREGFERRTHGWDKSEVKSSMRESLDGQESYWIRFYAHQSPEFCDVSLIERILIISYDGRKYGVVLRGSVCGDIGSFAVRDMETMLRSFRPAQTAAHAATPTPTPVGEVGSDRDALIALYNATGGANWTNNTGWVSSAPIGEWRGVTTDNDGRVTALRLPGNRLNGQIPPELGSLSNLVALFVHENRLEGEIPAELGSLSNLKELDIGGNHLSGQIPTWLSSLSDLTFLSLCNNRLTGKIPPELGSLTNLKVLSLCGNQLGGEIPPELGGLTGLEILELSGNRLTGCIPEALRRASIPEIDLPFCPSVPAQN